MYFILIKNVFFLISEDDVIVQVRWFTFRMLPSRDLFFLTSFAQEYVLFPCPFETFNLQRTFKWLIYAYFEP